MTTNESADRGPEPAELNTEPTDVDLVDADLVDPELEALMDRLRFIAGDVDAPPPLVADLARAALETRDLDAELAVLTADSDIDTLELVRSVAVAPRMVSFETDAVTIELQLDRHETSLTLRGLVVGAAGSIMIETADRQLDATVDDRGWFLVEDIPVGALRLRFAASDGSHVSTPWISG